MAESNLRTMLIAAKGSSREGAMGDAEMEAILGVLKEHDGEPSARNSVESVGAEPAP